MSENRRNRRKNKRKGIQIKSNISKKDKIYGILAIVAIFITAMIAVVYHAFANAR